MTMQKPPAATVLVVDDTEINLDILIEALSGQYEIIAASDGESALECMTQTVPDLILLDVLMPGMDGFEVFQRMRSQTALHDVPVIFLTSLSDDTSERRGLEMGAVDFIMKPFNPSLVRARVKNHLELKKHQDDLACLVAARTRELTRTREATIASMAILAEFRDNETGQHVQRTKSYVRALLFGMHGTPDAVNAVEIGLICQSAALHDIGKVGVPDGILFKTERLTPEEFLAIQRHTLVGAEVLRRTEAILGSNSFLRNAREIAEFHHERWDGTGYPHGLAGANIPISARVMAVADVYDALVSRRPYKLPFTHERAVDCILNGDDRTRPGHFCPSVLDAFKQVHWQFQAIALRFMDEAPGAPIITGDSANTHPESGVFT